MPKIINNFTLSGPYRKPVMLRTRLARLALAAIAVAALALLRGAQ